MNLLYIYKELVNEIQLLVISKLDKIIHRLCANMKCCHTGRIGLWPVIDYTANVVVLPI